MDFFPRQQWVPVSTIYGNLIKVLVHPGMSILEFKDKCFQEDLWSGVPICVLTPLAINVDMAALMQEGEEITDPKLWKMVGHYNRFRLSTKDGELLDDDGVLQQDMISDCKLFKVQWMKQFNLTDAEMALLVGCMTSDGPVMSFDVTINHNTPFLGFPFYGKNNELAGLVWQHKKTQGHCEREKAPKI